jgi:hypothetical protein
MFQPPIFDVSGVDGASGISGYCLGHSRASTGADGRNGGHGTNGKCGTPAGTINVRFTTPTTTANILENLVLPKPIDADVQLDASIVFCTGQVQKMDTILKIKSEKSMFFLALGGHGGKGGNGGDGEDGGHGYRYGAFLVSFNESISEYAWRTGGRMQLDTVTVLMAVLVVTEEMAVTQVMAVMVDLEEPFKSLLPKPTLISLCSVVPSSILSEGGVQQGHQGLEVNLFRVILPRPLSEINFPIRR